MLILLLKSALWISFIVSLPETAAQQNNNITPDSTEQIHYHNLGDIVVNPANTYNRMLMAAVVLEVPNAGERDLLRHHDIAAKDAVICVLSSKSVYQLLDPNNRERIKGEIQTKINNSIENVRVGRVYFEKFVMQ